MKKFNGTFFNPEYKIDVSVKNMPRLLTPFEITKIIESLNKIKLIYFASNVVAWTLNALTMLYLMSDPELDTRLNPGLDPRLAFMLARNKGERLISNFQTLLTDVQVLSGLYTISNMNEQISRFSLECEDIPGSWVNYGGISILLDESVELMNSIIRAHESGLISQTAFGNIKIVSGVLVGLNVLKKQLENGAQEMQTSVPNGPG